MSRRPFHRFIIDQDRHRYSMWVWKLLRPSFATRPYAELSCQYLNCGIPGGGGEWWWWRRRCCWWGWADIMLWCQGDAVTWHGDIFISILHIMDMNIFSGALLRPFKWQRDWWACEWTHHRDTFIKTSSTTHFQSEWSWYWREMDGVGGDKET